MSEIDFADFPVVIDETLAPEAKKGLLPWDFVVDEGYGGRETWSNRNH